jgi:hypothetical protein
MVLLALGAVGGFAAGIASMRCHRGYHGGWHGRRAAFEQHVAEVCTNAALRARAEETRR